MFRHFFLFVSKWSWSSVLWIVSTGRRVNECSQRSYTHLWKYLLSYHIPTKMSFSPLGRSVPVRTNLSGLSREDRKCAHGICWEMLGRAVQHSSCLLVKMTLPDFWNELTVLDGPRSQQSQATSVLQGESVRDPEWLSKPNRDRARAETHFFQHQFCPPCVTITHHVVTVN